MKHDSRQLSLFPPHATLPSQPFARSASPVVLNEADAQGKDNQEACDSLRDVERLEVAPLLIGRRKAFPNAASAGLSVLEWHDPKAIDEFGQLVTFLFGVSRKDIGVLSNGYR
jgi:hypothetical protein